RGRKLPAVRPGAGGPRVVQHPGCAFRVPAGRAANFFPEPAVSRGAGDRQSRCLRVVWARLGGARRRDAPTEASRLGKCARAREPGPGRGRLRMAWRFHAVLWLLAFPSAPPQRSVAYDDPTDGPKRIFQDDFIEYLVGDWKLTRKVRGTEV